MPTWQGSDRVLVEVMLREGETFLQAQLVVATSADQRAAVLGGIYAAAGTALVAGIIAAVAASSDFPHAVVLGCALAGALFLVSSALCLSTALPVDFWLPGNEPSNWYEDIEKGVAIEVALGEEAVNYQSKIDENNKALKANAGRYRWGVYIGIAAPVLGVIGGALASFAC